MIRVFCDFCRQEIKEDEGYAQFEIRGENGAFFNSRKQMHVSCAVRAVNKLKRFMEETREKGAI